MIIINYKNFDITIIINFLYYKNKLFTGILETDNIFIYYVDGKKHREDGSAVIYKYFSYENEYYLDNIFITNNKKDFKYALRGFKLKVFE